MEAGDLPFGFPEIHEHSDPKIVVNRHRAVQDAEDGQPVKFFFHRCAEDIELRHESAQGRNARHREEEDGHGSGEERVFESNPGIIIDQRILFSFLPKEDDTSKGPNVHKGIGHEIEKNP